MTVRLRRRSAPKACRQNGSMPFSAALKCNRKGDMQASTMSARGAPGHARNRECLPLDVEAVLRESVKTDGSDFARGLQACNGLSNILQRHFPRLLFAAV